MPTYSEIFEKACAKKCERCCPECDSTNSLRFADGEVLVCTGCGYSVDAEDLQSEWIAKISSEYNETF